MIYDWFEMGGTAGVYGIYGLLGGGKTLTAVEIAMSFLDKGNPVSTNIQLRNGYEKYEKYHFIPSLDGLNWWELPQGAPRGSNSRLKSAIIIDECAEWFDQFTSTSPVLKMFLSWLRHSSKRGQYIFLIVQKPEFLAKSLRLLVSYWVCCKDYASWRFPVIRITIPFMSNYVDRRLFDSHGELVSRGFCIADKRDIGRFYYTAQILSSDSNSNAAELSEIRPVYTLHSRSLNRFLIFLAFILVLWLF